MSSSFVFQLLACELRESAISEDPNIRLAMLGNVTSGFTGNPPSFKLDIYTHPVDYIFPPVFETVDPMCIGL